jgi:hypothetical protein
MHALEVAAKVHNRNVMHKISWSQVPLPATTAFLVLNVFVEDNWHATEACVTDDEEVIHQNIHALFDKATGLAIMANAKVANWDKFKQQVDEAEVPGQQAWRWPPPIDCGMGPSGKKKRKLGEAE